MTLAQQVSKIVAATLISFGFTPKAGSSGTHGAQTESTESTESTGAITKEIRDLISSQIAEQIGHAKDELAKAKNDLAAANTRIATLQAELNTARAEVDRLNAEAKTTAEQAAELARKTTAAQGVPVTQLPEGTGPAGTTDQQIESLQTQLAAETDPKKRYELAQKINQLIFGKPDQKTKTK